nr:MAG TPA: hypothetical protein [Caudoviricetes sp.]
MLLDSPPFVRTVGFILKVKQLKYYAYEQFNKWKLSTRRSQRPIRTLQSA